MALGAILFAQPPPPDNTKVNARDRQARAKTADQQSNAKSDVETTRAIRRAIVADKDLSTYAHNVKIITRAGKVTLKGPVKTAEEKKTVEAKAAEVAGAANVTNRVSIAQPSTKSTASKKDQ
jgi:osmotically-inducible protein OsmY